MGYGTWLHGEAVGAGMVMAAAMSVKEGYLSDADLHRVVELVKRAGLPDKPPAEMTEEDFMSKMVVDKKVVDGTLRLVLLEALGQAVITSDFSRGNLGKILSA